MFQSSLSRLRAWLTLAEDFLGDSQPAPAFDPHPHRRPLRFERARRPGSVPARPAHCVSPVRAAHEERPAHRAAP
jgi:hypothetical protein